MEKVYWSLDRRALPLQAGEDDRRGDHKMARRQYALAIRYVRTLFGVGSLGGRTDRELLDQFLSAHGHPASIEVEKRIEAMLKPSR